MGFVSTLPLQLHKLNSSWIKMSAKTSIARLLRAPWNFEEDYFEAEGNIPILFTSPFNPAILPAGTPDTITALDAEAGLQNPPAGISPLLARFSPSPIGATACFYFPIVRLNHLEINPVIDTGWAYVWRVIHRFRNVADFIRRKRSRVPYSIGVSRLGADDTRPGTVFDRPNLNVAGPRYIRTATAESIIYNRPLPSPQANPPFFGTLHADAVAIPVSTNNITPTPIYPGSGAGVPQYVDYEQGEYDPGSAVVGDGATAGASHVGKFVKCEGNEIAVECYKFNLETSGDPYTPRQWDFQFDGNGNVVAGEDLPFSILLGVGARGLGKTPPIDTGVRMVVGTWPR